MEREADIKKVCVKDAFWSDRQELIADVVIPYQEKILNDEIEGAEKSHAFENFRIAEGMEDGEFYGMVFQDSDVAKWLEGVAYSLADRPDDILEARADEIIATIEKAQQPDGYLNTFFTVKEPEHKWQNLLECHELYCAGHMMEAAAAYYEATGKDRLLKVMERMAENIAAHFGTEDGKERGIPGHEEVEVGLMRLYHVTGKKQYMDLAKYFIDERGQNPDYFSEEVDKRGWKHWGSDGKDQKYNQTFAPVREQKKAEGHSVRAVYLYTAMADLAAQTKDQTLVDACDVLWDNITQKRMYITAGIGQTAKWEGFTEDYDLPNDTVYAETCASIGLVFFARKMLNLHTAGKYADVMERALYNGILSGMQLDGKRFFYVNPLEVNPEISGKMPGFEHVLVQRPKWYACACCPPNVVRLVMSLGRYAWGEDKENRILYSHLFMGGSAEFDTAVIDTESEYPWNGNVSYRIHPKDASAFTLAIHIPSWVKNPVITLNGSKAENITEKDGYVYIRQCFQNDDIIAVTFALPVRRIYANTAVRADEGCTALMRGPIVYCFEGIDNGERLQELRIPLDAQFEVQDAGEDILNGMKSITFTGARVHLESEELYSEERPQSEPAQMKAIPYFAWGNRGENQMKIWMNEN